MKTIAFILIPGFTLVLAGCAATADYSESISRIDQAIKDSSNSIVSIDADLTARENARLKKQISDGTFLLETKTDQCAAGRNACSLVLLKKGPGGAIQEQPYPVTSTIPKGILALQMVNTYVTKLKAITEADTAAKVTASANSALSSIEEIAGRLAQEEGKSTTENKITEYKAPAMGLVGWIATKYIDRVKRDALAKATNEAHPVIKELTNFYSTAADALKVANFADAHVTFVNSQQQYDNLRSSGHLTPSLIDAYALAAENYDAGLKAEAAKPLKAFEVAHERLMNQLNGEKEQKTTLTDVASAIRHLEEEAKAVKALVDGFKQQSTK